MKIEQLKVPGATLHYEVRGSGPVLLLICGGIYDAEGFEALADELAGERTVVTYDRRGNSRSPLDGPPSEIILEEQADDAYRLLGAVGVTEDEPADVFGNSSGAVIALELAARYPGMVRTVVAHEPPLFELLPDFDRFRAVFTEVAAAYREHGTEAAMGVFGAAMAMHGDDDTPSAPPTAESGARMQRNMEYFIAYEVPPIAAVVPDLEGLRSGTVRIVPAVGATSAGEPPNRAGRELGARLDAEVVEFPHGHGGFGDAGPFAAKLRQVLAAP
ncbi:alpha/beta fold hydrolase [Dactylosporangium vinaceum]|uniref:Alpha/beta fold hydrolase n=1 Tax=Dactylosporangium vinaceum TaxID=53362 RepID=A0ABV5M6P7_9ACTN|nr:alpha/beta fold hydrolase [Dactylosporangium vinaceum]UAB97935.1 alpha/beta fold hydrolase [Dactylosporangium vinaceum]